ncbi:DeoR/GlpR family DNA-binding transcription regulator [Rhizobium sp. RCAM05973]|uniref:DeoR/GlpR family DNA-binding transcription regulator n=1 Tax=Rhizobium sp. RCAM05973 TaxID=2994066 RepID=UPI0022EBD6B6|nr:DeoR/GlpR family DNA-binding transcription regulator [Rhizobium sp. RCAM05973]
MLTEERHDKIREELARSGKVLAAKLAVDFDVSEDTIRRDLRELARLGVCRRVYGGALSPAQDLGSLMQRNSIMSAAKTDLARAVGDMIESGQTIFIDAGSTNVSIARCLPPDKEVTIVTNSPGVALALDEHPRCRTILLGGIFNSSKGACVGSQTYKEVQRIYADVFILGTCGVDLELGLTAFDAEEAELKRCMVDQASQLWVPATSDKLGTVAPYKIADSASIDVLFVGSDGRRLPAQAFEEKGVRVTVCL